MASTAKAGVSSLAPQKTEPGWPACRRRPGCYQSIGLGTKIAILDDNGIENPTGPGVLEVANQFFLLGIDTDDRQTLPGESVLLSGDIEALLSVIGVVGGGDLFAVHAKAEVHLLEQTALPKLASCEKDVAPSSAGPLDPRHGVARCIVLQQLFDSGDDRGGGFSPSFRPPLGLRIRSSSKSCSISSRRPLARV